MDQPISLMILRIIVVMTRGYLKCCNASLLIYRGYGKPVMINFYLDYMPKTFLKPHCLSQITKSD